MSMLPMAALPLYTAAQVRALDQRAIDTLDISGFELMRRAAQAALQALQWRWPKARRLLVACGPGNNGGDGYLLGALARQAGLAVELLAVDGEPRGDAARAREAFIAAGGVVRVFDPAAALPAAEVQVDAIYGTGLNRPPQGASAALIEAINHAAQPVLALDVPSGLDADSGRCPGVAIRASLTVGFIAAKRGLHTGQAADHVGQLVYDDLDLPAELCRALAPDARLLPATALPPRARAAHKGNHGHLLLIGGDHGTAGAVRLAGEAALRCGAGLVSVATQAEHVGSLNTARPELMAHAVQGPQALTALLEKASVLGVGPGLGQGAWGHALWWHALQAGKPMVLDADGLNLLARQPRRFDAPTVLTPHPGEAARLLQCTTAQVEADRFGAARALAERYAAVVVLKGSGSLVAAPDGRVDVCPFGNPGMASGGMGDLLTGVIAALLAQGLGAWEAAGLGVSLHARAGDLAARDGERGLLASDLLAPLRQLINGMPDA